MLSASGDGGGLTGSAGGVDATEPSELVASLAHVHYVPDAQFAPQRDDQRATVATGKLEQSSDWLVTTNLTVPIRSIKKGFAAPVAMIPRAEADLLQLELMHVKGSPILPVEYVRGIRQLVANDFAVADRPGLGLALFDSWTGHDGIGDGTSCQLRIDLAAGTVAALTGNASTGVRLCDELVDELGRRGLPIPSGSLMVVPDIGLASRGCIGSYRNDDTKHSTYHHMHLLDGDSWATILFQDGLILSLQGIHVVQRMYAGRCPVTGKTETLTGD